MTYSHTAPEPLESDFDTLSLAEIKSDIAQAGRNIFNETWQLKILISGLVATGAY